MQCCTSKKPIWNISGAAFNSLGNGRDVDLEAIFEYYTKSVNYFFKDGTIKRGLMCIY